MNFQASSSKPASSKPVDLAAELEAKKNNLQHVEVKDYASPTLQSPEENARAKTANSKMTTIIAKRNQMKKSWKHCSYYRRSKTFKTYNFPSS